MNHEAGTRWKYHGAKEFAHTNAVSDVYTRLHSLVPLESFIAQTSVVLHVGSEQADLLNRACFGRPILEAPLASSSSSLGTSRNMGTENGTGVTTFFELGLEEAFFLCYELKCLHVYVKTTEGRVRIDHDDLWRLMQNRKQGFLDYYKAYSHLRNKNWVIRTGLQYGADFVAYCHHPAQVHSEYAVIVLPESGKQNPLTTWTHLQGMIRLCGSVAKTLLLLHIITSSSSVDTTTPNCLRAFSVQEMEVKRWLPEKNREDDSTSYNIP